MQKQIHHVVVRYHERYVVDPELGPVKRREEVLAASDTDRIVHEGETYEVGIDGSFTVPAHVAEFMTRMPGWYEGPSPFSQKMQPPAEQKAPAPEPRRPEPAPAPAPSASSAPTS